MPRRHLTSRTSRTVTVALVVIAGLLSVAPSSAGAKASTGSTQPTGRTDYTAVVATLSAEIPQVLASTGAVGLTIALVDGDRVVWTQGFGYADRESGRAVTPDTLFHIGSASKTVSAIAVMQLVQRGLVDLDAPMSRYVPEFRLLPRFRRNVITVRSVLDHHSGIPGDVFNGLITTGRPDPGFRRWLLRALRGMYPERRVNTQYAYNNSGYVLLQNLVENVTGMPFQRYTRTQLFGPMQMPSTTFDDRVPTDARLTRNYQVVEAPDGSPAGATLEPREYVNGWTAGSITSSANDMANYLRTLLSGGRGPAGRILRRTTLHSMWRVAVRPPLDISVFRFGLGFGLEDPALEWAGRVVWHDGATVWNHTMLKLLPDSRLGVFVSTNSLALGAPSATVAARALTLAVTAKTGVTPPSPAPLPDSPAVPPDPEAVAPYAGDAAGSTSVDRILVTIPGLDRTARVGTATAATTAFTPHADGWFRAANGAAPIRFRTVQGHRLTLARLDLGTGAGTVIAGERIPAYRIARPWRERVGTYRAVDAVPNVDPSLVARRVTISPLGRRLVMDLSSEWGRQALVPGPAGSMLTFGMGIPLGRGKGDCLIPYTSRSGRPGFTYLGVRYVRTGPIGG